jgi:hypothetical protein
VEAVVIGKFVFNLVTIKCRGRKCRRSFKVLESSKQKFCSAHCAGVELPLQNYNHAQRVQKYKGMKEAIADFYNDSEDESGA